MDYETKYKEAVGKIKELFEEKKKKEMTNCLFEGELRDIFSELCESEDERIRKALLRFFREYQGGCPAQGFSRAEAVAWLEKQGEQKPGDKVKPMFKIGDWIINNITGFVYIVKDKGYGGYIVVNRENHQYTISTEKEKDYRLWTIQDAKAGDVLYLQKDGKEHIIIYKGVNKERFRTFVSAYCAYNGIVNAFCFADVSRYVDIAYRGIMPATKEQRDLLFQKMHEVGYEWDAEKKELKKIEQKPAEWSEEDEENLKWFEKFFRAESVIAEGKDIPQDRYLWLKSLKGRVQPQPKQEWDGGDEAHRPQMQWKAVDKEIYVKEPALAQRKDKSEPNHGYVICYDHTLTPDVYERFIRISDIYNQSHWKPSEKQMKWLHDAIESTQYEPRKQALISLYSDLMGLKD